MKRFCHRLLASLTPGVSRLLFLLLLVYLTALLGRFFGSFDLYHWLALSGPNFWSGRVWQLTTYALLPVSGFDFLINGLMIFIFGGLLERIWSRWDFWTYCVVVLLGTGLFKVFFQFSNQSILTGTGSLCFGLLAAWGFVFGHEKIPFGPLGEWTVSHVAMLAGLINFIALWASIGLVDAVVLLGGGLTGLLYLWCRVKWIHSRESHIVHSERINRLEL